VIVSFLKIKPEESNILSGIILKRVLLSVISQKKGYKGVKFV
jgi:hypothetical protein